MNGPVASPPVLVTCLRCGREVSTWTVVLWQSERDRGGAVEVVGGEALAILCPLCAEAVQEAVRTAVDSATA